MSRPGDFKKPLSGSMQRELEQQYHGQSWRRRARHSDKPTGAGPNLWFVTLIERKRHPEHHYRGMR